VERGLCVNVSGQTQLFAQIDAKGNVSWYLTDHLGSVRLITDNSAAVIDHIDYDTSLWYHQDPKPISYL
jgi:hypothetical protein